MACDLPQPQLQWHAGPLKDATIVYGPTTSTILARCRHCKEIIGWNVKARGPWEHYGV